MIQRTSVLALLVALFSLACMTGRRLESGVPGQASPAVPAPDWLPALERHLLLRQLGMREAPPPSWRAISRPGTRSPFQGLILPFMPVREYGNGVTARAPGMRLWVSQAVGLAPLRIAIRWRVELREGDRSLELVAVEEESEMMTHRSDTSLTEPGQTARTVNAHWELGASGRYVVAGCVRPRGACVGQAVVVS